MARDRQKWGGHLSLAPVAVHAANMHSDVIGEVIHHIPHLHFDCPTGCFCAGRGFWPSISGNKKEGHNLGTWPRGEKRSFKFDQPGVVPLLCNVHSEMAGYIIVSPTPYFAETDAGGNFKIENVPDGKYNLVAWHEGMKSQSKPVIVAGSAKVDFTLSK